MICIKPEDVIRRVATVDVMGMWRGYVMILSRRTASCAQLLGKPPSTPVLALSLLRALESALAGCNDLAEQPARS